MNEEKSEAIFLFWIRLHLAANGFVDFDQVSMESWKNQ
jgi:hypothetical protein